MAQFDKQNSTNINKDPQTEYITIGEIYNENKIAKIKCISNDPFNCIEIKNKRFLMVVLYDGQLVFERGGKHIAAIGPSFICFNEEENPVLVAKKEASYQAIYFHPDYLNINMTFEFIRSRSYEDVAGIHDMFLLKPFLDNSFVIPIGDSFIERAQSACEYLQASLTEQRDWYWSCKGRSYFIELIITLERMYELLGYRNNGEHSEIFTSFKHPKLRAAVLFIEGHYMKDISLGDISSAAGLNHTTLTKLIKSEIGMTVTQYLYFYRIQIAKKKLAFTNVPIKEISYCTGFKTVPHFSRTFTNLVGQTPADYRKTTVQKRKIGIK